MKLAVIVPVYKVEAYLHQCIDSILSQSYRELKVILVDDGSPDSCGVICDEYAVRDSRVLVLHKANGGLSSARNLALPYTDDCPLVTFVDSDDWLEPGIYQSAVSYLQQHPEVSILGYGHNKVQDTCSSPCLMPEMTLSREEALDSYLTANKLAIEATVWSRIYRRQAIEGLTFREGSKWEDNVYSLEAFYQSTGDFHTLPIAGYNYRIQRPGAITATEIPDLRDLFADIEESIDRHAGDTTYMEYANTLALLCLWRCFRILCRVPGAYEQEAHRYLPWVARVRKRPYLAHLFSPSKRLKIRLFLFAPEAFLSVRRAFSSLKRRH
ncbi:MAG: glycosyltransferase family 2 protein [Porphyromonadaceae bacterium]|nr:glycosyltransferase family 2 protein [Porphyromonadaceae bacterium]